jgi:stress response protein YsnF
MSRTVTALYDTREEADRALRALTAEISLAHAEVFDCASDGAALSRVDLTDEERASCERKMASGDHMLLAQVHSGEAPDRIIAVLERIADEATERVDFGAAPADEEVAPAMGTGDTTEQTIPLVEEELRVGTREVVRGGARVHTRVEDVPVQQDIELFEEHARVERRPATRLVPESELQAGDVLRERVIEIAQMREEAVVTKEAYVREEVVVSKTIERRIERIDETVRRTEVDVDRMEGGGERPAFSSLGGDRPDPTR